MEDQKHELGDEKKHELKQWNHKLDSKHTIKKKNIEILNRNIESHEPQKVLFSSLSKAWT